MTKDVFADLVLESEETLYRISMSMLKNETDCEDAVQTAILKAYEKLSTLKNEGFFKTWLVRILINVCNDQLKQKNRTTDISEYTEYPDKKSPSNEGLEVREAIESLPVKIRQVIVLYYIEDFSISEIKSILKIPEGTVKSRLSKGRTLLHQQFE